MTLRWTRTMIDQAAATIQQEVVDRLQQASHAEVLDYCLERLNFEPEGKETPEGDAARVYYAIASIALVTSRPSHAEQLVPKLDKFVKGILAAYNVKPRKSTLSHMYQHLALAKAYYYSQKGEIGRAVLESSLGFAISKNTFRTGHAIVGLVHANIVLQKGFAAEAAKIFGDVRQGEGWGYEIQLALIAELRCLRLSGQFEAAKELCEAYRARPMIPAFEHLRDWDRVAIQVPEKGVYALEQYAQKGTLLEKGVYALNKLWLLNRIVSMKDFGIKGQHVRQAYNRMIIKDLRFRYGTEVIEEFEKILDTTIPFERRLIQAQGIFEMADKLDIETRVMTLAALSRWYERNDQRPMGFIVGEEYRALSLRLSAGKSDNVLEIYGFRGVREQASHAAVNDWLDKRAQA